MRLSTKWTELPYRPVSHISLTIVLTHIGFFLLILLFGKPPGAGPPSIGWNLALTSTPIAHHTGASQPPPLPPRNNKSSPNQELSVVREFAERSTLDRRKIPTKLYENVIINKTYDAELVAFYNMVKQIRSEFKYNDESTNVGHIVAAEFNNNYSENTSIKLLVHPLMKSFNAEAVVEEMAEALAGDDRRSRSSTEGISMNSEKGQVEGYGPPVVFTCDSEYYSKSTKKEDSIVLVIAFYQIFYSKKYTSLSSKGTFFVAKRSKLFT